MALKSFVSMILKPMNLSSFSPKLRYLSFKAQCYNFVSLALHSNRKLLNKSNIGPETGFDESKAKLILSLNFKSAEDALPFYKLPMKTLIHIYQTNKNDEAKGFCINRLYYISSRIKVPSEVLSEKLVKRSFVYSLSFEWIKRALDVLLEMGVSGEGILRDLWVLKYHHETIRNRLQIVKNNGVEILHPWMVRCSEEILNRFLSISQETKDILGETKSTKIYLANRLNTSVEAIETMCMRMPALKTIRVTKVKKFLDFLINEGFPVEDIANKPRVLSASQKTVEERIEKLRKLGISQINLNVLCRSKKGFKRYCDSIQSIKENENDGLSSV
ncbi:unnamed protein product [Arctia plantaginis]|uniref:Transcription termination factor, mitochondrial n=1 Tax=Arctia plantaginis TaxID=874455 RepID=A0A8S0ZIN7_ARCPL|nr:unnamed protein product [Arctia plantaginis]CAB3249862.1 unnamed protein product [Arctia plantaginis]